MKPQPSVPRPFSVHTRQTAFSLVEVVLAVGVISFAFVAILGLIPAGLAQFRQAMDNSVAAQISQRIILECQESDFMALTNSTGASTSTLPSGALAFQPLIYNSTGSVGRTTRYFDEQGNEVITAGPTPTQNELMGGMTAGSTAKAALGILYFVNTRITQSTSVPGPGYTSVLNAKLATITVQVAFNPSGKTLMYQQSGTGILLIDPATMPKGTIRTFSAQIGSN